MNDISVGFVIAYVITDIKWKALIGYENMRNKNEPS